MATGELKNFYPISEFYNFIKSPGNIPMPQSLATAVPHPHYTCNEYDRKTLFNADNLYKFALSLNTCKIPSSKISDGAISIKNAYGVWETLSNEANIFPDKQTVEMKFLETSNSVIETFIFPWMLACLNSNSGPYSYPFPRMDLSIKLYRPIDFYTLPAGSGSIKVTPYIVYWFDGIFPESIEHISIDQNEVNASHTTRAVTFKFNSFMCFPSISVAKLYRMDHLFEGVTLTPPKQKNKNTGKNQDNPSKKDTNNASK